MTARAASSRRKLLATRQTAPRPPSPHKPLAAYGLVSSHAVSHALSHDVWHDVSHDVWHGVSYAVEACESPCDTTCHTPCETACEGTSCYRRAAWGWYHLPHENPHRP